MTAALSPAQMGFRMPAEWEPHAATWLTWPRPNGISFPDRYFSVPPVYAKLVHQLVQLAGLQGTGAQLGQMLPLPQPTTKLFFH